MTQQFARVPIDASDVVRQVRGFGGVPWNRLLRYLRPHWAPFSIALVGLVLSSSLGLLFPLVIAGLVAIRTRSLLLPIAVHIGLDIPIYYAFACAT